MRERVQVYQQLAHSSLTVYSLVSDHLDAYPKLLSFFNYHYFN